MKKRQKIQKVSKRNIVKEEKPKKFAKSSIVCSKCMTKKTTTKQQMQKLIATFGSIEDVHEKYHCIKCRKEFNVRKDGRSKPEKRQRKKSILEVDEATGKTKLPEWMSTMKLSNNNEAWAGAEYSFKKPEAVSNDAFIKAIRAALINLRK